MASTLRTFVDDRTREWRSGSTSSQRFVLMLLLVAVGVSWTVSWHAYPFLPMTAYFVWLLIGTLTLRFPALSVLAAAAFTAGLSAMLHDPPLTSSRVAVIITWIICATLILVHSRRQRTGLPLSLSEAMLVDLRDRLQSQGTIPALPQPWLAPSAMVTAQGLRYAGDFLVADLDTTRRRLELVLVDVCGKGVTAGAQALHFAGALGGLLGALEQPALFRAANAFLLRQQQDESFATAVHLRLDLVTGEFAVTSAGHPPALRWDAPAGEWLIDGSRGTALGIIPDPELHTSHGVLAPGEALLFYTDGVIEAQSRDLEAGIAWLRSAAGQALDDGYAAVPRRVVAEVRHGDDDRAVLVVSRGSHRQATSAAAIRAPEVPST